IMLLHREEYYHVGDQEWADENPDKIGLSELIIAKQRNGPTGTVKLSWDNSTTRFKNHTSHIGSFGSDRRDAPPRRDDASPGTYCTGAGAGGPASGLAPRSRPAGPVIPTPAGAPVGFAPGSKSGPMVEFRDGGGPEPAPFDDDDDRDDIDSVAGLPI